MRFLSMFFGLGHRIACYYPCYITLTANRTSVGGIFKYFELYTLWLIFFFSVAASLLRFLDRTQPHTHETGLTHLNECSARRRGRATYTTHKGYKRRTSVPSAGFEPTVSASKRPQTQALDRTALWSTVTQIVCRNGGSYHILQPVTVKPVLNGAWA